MHSRDPVLGLRAGRWAAGELASTGEHGAARAKGRLAGRSRIVELQAGRWALHKGAERGGAWAQKGQVSVPTRTSGSG